MNRLIVVVLTLLFIACNNENHKKVSTFAGNKKDNLLRVLTYCLADLQGGTAEAVIAKQYGFCYYPVTGCVITKQLADSITDENNKTYEALARQYGDDSRQQYNKKIDSLSALFKQVKAIVNNDSLLQKANHQQTRSLYYHVSPTDTANFFFVQAFAADSNNLAYTFRVNLQNRLVYLVK